MSSPKRRTFLIEHYLLCCNTMTAVIMPFLKHNANSSHTNNRLPVVNAVGNVPKICLKCQHVNNITHHFCTFCGYPVTQGTDWMAIYDYRQKQWQKQLTDCRQVVGQARGILYLIALVCTTGALYVLFKIPVNLVRGGVLTFIALLYFGLGKYSKRQPFTALIGSFLTLLSFIAINAWAEYGRIFTTSAGVYLMFIQFVLFYFIFRGAKAAYQAEVLEEENSI